MKKFLFLSFFLLIGSSMVDAQPKSKNYEEAYEIIQVWLDAQKDFDQLPGLTAIIIGDQDVLWSGAVGLANPEKNLKAEISTLCSICSISKLFTAVAVMKLYDDGELSLDEDVNDLLPHYDLQQKYPDSGPITIRSVLTHSSGLPREANYPYWTGPDFAFPTQEEVNVGLKDQETLYKASTYFQYSNLGLTLLGEIVEQVSGMPYETYIQEHILDPLRLTNTRSDMPEELYGSDLAIGYSAITREGDREKVNFFQANGIKAAAGFSSNVEDLGKFASWQLRLRDTSATEVLKPSTIRQMHNVHWTNPDWSTTWGLGFRVYQGPGGSTWVGHGGSCPGYRSTLEIDLKKKRAYAVMINASGTNPMKYVRGIHSILEKVKTMDEVDTSEKDLKDYVGYYSTQPWWSEQYVTTWAGNLVSIDLPTDEPAESMTFFKHLEGDIFQRIRKNGEPGETLTFIRGTTGEITHCESHGNYWQKIDRKSKS